MICEFLLERISAENVNVAIKRVKNNALALSAIATSTKSNHAKVSKNVLQSFRNVEFLEIAFNYFFQSLFLLQVLRWLPPCLWSCCLAKHKRSPQPGRQSRIFVFFIVERPKTKVIFWEYKPTARLQSCGLAKPKAKSCSQLNKKVYILTC